MYNRIDLDNGRWVYCTGDYYKPNRANTGAMDTENITLINGNVIALHDLKTELDNYPTLEDKRNALSCHVWAWQTYDEYNGFFITNDFYVWLDWLARVRYKFVWTYNARFDFSQIDYKILVEHEQDWQQYEKHSKGKAWQYNSLHNNMGARYSYKLWLPYKNENRHTYVHSVALVDFANIYGGGLANMLESLDVRDNENVPIRKLSMDYQDVNINDPSNNDLEYCEVDVKGLYFGVKQYNTELENITGNECHIFGSNVNVITAGGCAKRELLRSIYPVEKDYKTRLKLFQQEHPITPEQDSFLRANHLYRGGCTFINPAYKDKLVFGKMYRYDVNSEYPYSMYRIPDLYGEIIEIPYKTWLEQKEYTRDDYECIYELKHISGTVKEGYLGFWYDPFEREYCNDIWEDNIEDIENLHLIFEFELAEYQQWYDDMTIICPNVLVIKKGSFIFRQFVRENYERKKQAGINKNKGQKAAAKLFLNSSYGKLAERIERITGVYESTPEGYVHYKETGRETDEKSRMSVILGSYITAYARVWLMSNIRMTYGNKMREQFVYCDTDSIHGFLPMDSDPDRLGAFKLETECTAIKYLAPKTYLDISTSIKDENGCKYVDSDGIEIHTKGVKVAAVKASLGTAKILLDDLDKKFAVGQKYVSLGAINCKGGKVLVPLEKYLVVPDETEEMIQDNTAGQITYER